MKTTKISKVSRYAPLSIALFATVLLSSSISQADVLASYDMQETDGAAITAASVVHADLAASDLTAAGSHADQSGKLQLANVDPADDYITWRSLADNGNDVAGAISANSYFYLTLTPDAGKSMSITSISFDAVAGTAGPSTRSAYLMSSKAGAYEAGNELLTATPLVYNTSTFDQNYSVDVSGISGFQNITDTTFLRFYIQTPGTHQNVGFDDITVNGSVIPEPATISFFGFAGIAVMAIRRFRM